MFYSNICSSFSAAVLSELFRKWLYISVVVLVLAWPALPATVTSGTPAAICMVMFVCRKLCTVLPLAERIAKQLRTERFWSCFLYSLYQSRPKMSLV